MVQISSLFRKKLNKSLYSLSSGKQIIENNSKPLKINFLLELTVTTNFVLHKSIKINNQEIKVPPIKFSIWNLQPLAHGTLHLYHNSVLNETMHEGVQTAYVGRPRSNFKKL